MCWTQPAHACGGGSGARCAEARCVVQYTSASLIQERAGVVKASSSSGGLPACFRAPCWLARAHMPRHECAGGRLARHRSGGCMRGGGPSATRLGGLRSPSPCPTSAAPRSTGRLSIGTPAGAVPSRQLSSQSRCSCSAASSPSAGLAPLHRRPHQSATAAKPPSPTSSTTMALPAVADVSAIVGPGCSFGGNSGGLASGGGGGGGGDDSGASARHMCCERDCGNAHSALHARPGGRAGKLGGGSMRHPSPTLQRAMAACVCGCALLRRGRARTEQGTRCSAARRRVRVRGGGGGVRAGKQRESYHAAPPPRGPLRRRSPPCGALHERHRTGARFERAFPFVVRGLRRRGPLRGAYTSIARIALLSAPNRMHAHPPRVGGSTAVVECCAQTRIGSKLRRHAYRQHGMQLTQREGPH